VRSKVQSSILKISVKKNLHLEKPNFGMKKTTSGEKNCKTKNVFSKRSFKKLIVEEFYNPLFQNSKGQTYKQSMMLFDAFSMMLLDPHIDLRKEDSFHFAL
jgi:hypothetical protein